MKTVDYFKKYSIYALLLVGVLFIGCTKDDDDPAPENELEVITDVKLIFTNTNDANDVVTARAQDPDGPGVQELAILDTINLGVGKTYTLTYEIFNNLETPGENIGDEIKDEDDEHQFFFSFSNNAFANPTGNGNIDTASDPINYNDNDGTNPVGLSTTWTTSTTQLTNGTFTVRLQHQPGVKTATSGATDGDTDFNLPFVLNIR
ncbi:MAG TPA: GTP cyclohydrolase [Microscillaceae bacterium]|nr:GTP cyclohydrolase [Microscillaceae bacterium]